MNGLSSPFTTMPSHQTVDRQHCPAAPRQSRNSFPALVVVPLLFTTNISWAETVIDTTGWVTVSYVLPFGEPGATTYGQTFRPPNGTDTQLDSFSFYIRPELGQTYFQAGVYEWNETAGQVVGDVLFTGHTATLAPRSDDEFQAVTSRTGGLVLSPDREYVVFLSTARQFDNVKDYTSWSITSDGDAYTAGHFVWDQGNFPAPGKTWSCGTGCSLEGPANDLAFTMKFSMAPIPEPATTTLILAGLCMVGTITRRRQKKINI